MTVHGYLNSPYRYPELVSGSIRFDQQKEPIRPISSFGAHLFLYFYSMKRQNEQPLKEVIQQLLDTYHLKEKVNELRLVQSWETLFGKTIARYTQKMFVSNKKLHLTITSAPLRQELMYSREKLIERINEAIEEDFVREVVVR